MSQLQIEKLAKQYANAKDLAGRGKESGHKRLEKLHAKIETLSLGQQLAVSTIAYRIRGEA